MITKGMIMRYEKECGTESAIALLLLGGPDHFEGDYIKIMEELEEKLS